MCVLKSLYFPGTSIYSPQQYPMFLLPLNIHILQPVEGVELASDVNLADSFIKNGFCQGYTPTPLGEDRDRFIHLVGDIQNRKDDYAAQLSQLTIATMTSKNKAQMESKNDIISSLISTSSNAQKEEQEQNTDLWQARLMLNLAEMLDREEEELSRNLSVLEDYEAELLQELQGHSDDDEENPFADLQQLKKNMISQRTGAMKNRLAAWCKLNRESDFAQDISAFITDSNDATDLLLEAYHEATNELIEPVVTAFLPPIADWDSSKAVEKILSFKDKFDQANDFAAVLSGTNQNNDIVEKWNNAIEEAFPKDTFGRKSVSVYTFSGYSCFDLMLSSPEKSGKDGILIAIDSNH